MREHELRIETIPIEHLRPHEDNANQGDLDAIEESILVNGLYQPILVQASTMRIIAGNHRYAAATRLGMRDMPGIILDVDDEQAKRIMVADNRTARLGHDDPALIYALLDDLRATDEGLAGTGYDSSDLMILAQAIDEPFIAEEEEPEADPEPAKGGDEGLNYVIYPIKDDDGVVHSFEIVKGGGGRLTAHDYAVLEHALGHRKPTRAEIDAFEVPSWSPR